MGKLKKSNYDETKKSNGDEIHTLKLWWNSKIPNCYETQKLKLSWTSKTQKNSIGDKTQKLKWWPDLKAQIVTKPKNSNCDKTEKSQMVKKLKNSYCDKTQNVTKLKNSNCDKTQEQICDKTQKLKLWKNFNHDKSQLEKNKT